MSVKNERLAKTIEREISNILLFKTKDQRLKYITITGVRLNNDFSIATVYYTVIGDEEQKKSTAKNLEDAKGFIKTLLGETLEIRKVPELIFKYDESIEYGNRIEEILKNLK
ncbi:MAG: 30S ribosome-binding factor RbfA [Acholeplasmataceae bacterium]|nr:30S ribosome-binding factor RbfA [Acholeplasmataceae bacterium]HOA63874.1 30S ribosome-binding factor RbfA [Bacilli bacterium]HPT89134.1 30S ribosome-binding factor RbfA [Bacilli bacterium]HQA19756.1 30S ribosome-binding factor RbfA [Bacilli bacterium]